MSSFLAPREVSRAFRGPVAVDVTRADGTVETRYLHVSQRLGANGSVPLATITLAPGEQATATFRMRYPANATAPHFLTLQADPA